MTQRQRQAVADAVSPEMLESGVSAFLSFFRRTEFSECFQEMPSDEDKRKMVHEVFDAMRRASRS
jgi:hypothetical protein